MKLIDHFSDQSNQQEWNKKAEIFDTERLHFGVISTTRYFLNELLKVVADPTLYLAFSQLLEKAQTQPLDIKEIIEQVFDERRLKKSLRELMSYTGLSSFQIVNLQKAILPDLIEILAEKKEFLGINGPGEIEKLIQEEIEDFKPTKTSSVSPSISPGDIGNSIGGKGINSRVDNIPFENNDQSNIILDQDDFNDLPSHTGGSRSGDMVEEMPNEISEEVNESSEATTPIPQKQQFVNTGFSIAGQVEDILDQNLTLKTKQLYFFWIQIGELLKGSIESSANVFPSHLIPEATELEVSISSFKGHFKIDELADLGVLEIKASQEINVRQQAMDPFELAVSPSIAPKRLFFPVETGERQGQYRLICNIYYKKVLIQSRQIDAMVSSTAEPKEKALISHLTYTLSQSLNKERLQAHQPHNLSVLLHESGGSHSFLFFGQDRFKNNATFEASEISNLLAQIRRSLKMVMWGSDQDLKIGQDNYRYLQTSIKQLRRDLTRLARDGYRFYDAIINRISAKNNKLQEIMRHPGHLQVALQSGARTVLPLALIYDYPIDTSLELDDYRLCEVFEKAIKEKTPLQETACFKGKCPNRRSEDGDVICPSGFWGFRHYLGLPHSIGSNPYAPLEIPYAEQPEFVMSVSTDPLFVMRPDHEVKLADLLGKENIQRADNRKDTLNVLKNSDPQVVYFYCHGGITKQNVPYLMVGHPQTERPITRDNLRFKEINWHQNTPLVFINGCHTTALHPDQAIEFVSGFVETTSASGVIGTEISIFEPLATAFAEAFFRRFLNGESAGEAVRNSRLDLLQSGNPLGLVYIPYVVSGLRLVKTEVEE